MLDKKQLSPEDLEKLTYMKRYLEMSEKSNKETSNGMKIALGTLITGALLYFGCKNFGSPFHRDYMNPQQIQSQSQPQSSQDYIAINPNLPRNNPNGYSVIDTHSTTRQEFRRGGKYNHAGYSTRQSQTTHTIVPNTPVYIVPNQPTIVQSYTPKPCDKAKNYPKPCDKEQTSILVIPPKPIPEPEIIPTPSPLEEKIQEREY